MAVEFDLPNLHDQQHIGKILKVLDQKIELNRRMNETLEEMARALFRDWFVDFGPTRRQADGATDPAAIVDTKAIEKIGNNEKAQIINYLKITGLRVGLLLNFKHAKLEWERIVL